MITSEMIIEARNRTGESQAQFAERIGVKQSAISRWESGRRPNGAARKMLERVVAQIADEASA